MTKHKTLALQLVMSLGCLASAPYIQASTQEHSFQVGQVWRGTYVCDKERDLEIKITEAKQGMHRSTAGTLTTAEVSWRFSGSFRQEKGGYYRFGYDWGLKQPEITWHSPLNFEGSIDTTGKKFNAKITYGTVNKSKCSDLTLELVASPSEPTPAQAPAATTNQPANKKPDTNPAQNQANYTVSELAGMDQDELETRLRSEFKLDRNQQETATSKALRHAWLKHVPSGEIMAEINNEVAAVKSKLIQLDKLMDEHQRTGSLVTTEFFGSQPKWVMPSTSLGDLETSHPFYSGHLDYSVWGQRLDRDQPLGRRIKNIQLTHAGYESRTVTFNNILPVMQADEDELLRLKNLFRHAGVPEGELETALEMLVSQYLDYIELARSQIYDQQVALYNKSLLGGTAIERYRPAADYLNQHINSAQQLLDFNAIAKMLDQNQQARSALSIKVSETDDYREWQPERYIDSTFGALNLKLMRSKFKVGDGLTEELRASVAIEFKMLLDELVSQGIAVKLPDEYGYSVYADAEAVDGIPGRILFSVDNAEGLWENRSYSMYQQYKQLDVDQHNRKIRKLFERYMEQVRTDIADIYLNAQPHTEDNGGTPF